MNTDEMITIPLTRGLSCLIEAGDADLAGHRWHAALKARAYPYARRSVGAEGHRKWQHLHRLILERMIGRPLRAGEEVDHINGNSLDNRRSNLRLVTRRQNVMNSRKPHNNTSGRKGVIWADHARRWRATIQVNGRRKHLGYYRSLDEAYAAYCEAAQRFFGEFARLE